MPTDPFVASRLADTPRQAPNLAPGVTMPPRRAGGWFADRPGDLRNGQPAGAMLGSPGPNVGYALGLAHARAERFTCAPHEHAEDVVAVVAELAMRRAASFGRAPVGVDVECAAILLGNEGGCEPDFARWRVEAGAGAAHDYARRRMLCDHVDLAFLRLPPAELQRRAGEARAALREAAQGLAGGRSAASR